MELLEDTVGRFRKMFGSEPTVVAAAPGRVNLIGEHTDYNEGFVLPLAIDRHIIIAAGPRPDRLLRLHSVDLQQSITASLDALQPDPGARWSHYPIGVAAVLRERGLPPAGANFCIRGNIPMASGLSSSAALEVASALVFRRLNGFDLSLQGLAGIARAAETDFVGVQCGIMDQFISLMGRKDHALFLDCRDLTYAHVPFPPGARLVVCDSGVRRELANSAYNLREAECEDAVRAIARRSPGVASLRDISPEQLLRSAGLLSPVSRRRAEHVVTENERVLKSVEAMKRNDLPLLGRLMTESHVSLRDRYEVSCSELDALVEIANSTPGVFGARMTGAGFGGSAVCLVAADRLDPLIDHLRAEYPKRVGRSLTITIAAPSDGASLVDVPELDTAGIRHLSR